MRIRVTSVIPKRGEPVVPEELRILRWIRHSETDSIVKMFCQGQIGTHPYKETTFLVLQTPYWSDPKPDEKTFVAQKANSIDYHVDIVRPYVTVEVDVPPQPRGLEIAIGDKVTIHAKDRTLRGTIISAMNWGSFDDEPPNWYLEYTIDERDRLPNRGEYGYWKQGEDGGWVEKI